MKKKTSNEPGTDENGLTYIMIKGVTPGLKKDFKTVVKNQGKTFSSVLRKFLREYVDNADEAHKTPLDD
jgi:hypothetical protein